MPTVHIELFSGRTFEQKRACAVAVTEAVTRTLGGSPETLDVVFVEVERHNWATGGQLWSDRPGAPKPAS